LKHIFIINPMAGKGLDLDSIRPQIKEICDRHTLEYEIHVTSNAYEAIGYIKERAGKEPDEHFRFYASGGDGTVYEVANGIYGLPNAEFAVIPLGSGNDFVRLFGGKAVFLDLENVILGTAIDIDIIDCGNGQIAVNQCSMGFDAETTIRQIKYKKLPFLNGEMSYVAALINTFLTGMGANFTLEIDGVPFDNGGYPYLLCAVANSRWYGGGFMVAPRAIPDDGYLDCVIISMQDRKLKMMPIATAMRTGKHLEYKGTSYIRCKTVSIKAPRDSALQVDGEVSTHHKVTFSIREKALKFVLPLGHTYDEVRAQWEADEVANPVQFGVV
jgi:YegS/Rv2252/BmrU family lipid kinase